jgi:hypothetical protein
LGWIEGIEMTQPEALRLADELEKDRWQITGVTAHEASEELRRLHALLGKANALCRIRLDRIEKLEAVMENAEGNLERISLVQTGVGIGKQAEQAEPVGWVTAGQHTAPLRTHWEGCEAVHPECRKPEQAEQAQPVARIGNWGRVEWYDGIHPQIGDVMYSAPPPRQPLTEQQISKLWDEHTCPLFGKKGINPIEFARAIEAAHGIK